MAIIYLRTECLIPTEPARFKYTHHKPDGTPFLYDPDEYAFVDYDKEYVDCDCFLEDIRKNGIKYALCVDSDYIIRDGNCRYWCAIKLGIEYLPVSLEYFLALTNVEKNMLLYPKQRVKII